MFWGFDDLETFARDASFTEAQVIYTKACAVSIGQSGGPMFRPYFAFLILLLSLVALPARADGYERIATREDFLAAVEGRDMRIGLLGITLNVQPDGSIIGNAMGWAVTGSWEWQDGFFCREMDWSGTPIPMNCQLVERRGDDIRFTVDKGKGDSARFALR
jgi:hypothetical protein